MSRTEQEKLLQLMNACARSDKYEVESLIREGLAPQTINQKNSRGKTALMIACENAGPDFNQLKNQNRLEIVKLLLDARADPSLKDEDGQNSLMLLFNKFSPVSMVFHNAEEAVNSRKIDGKLIGKIIMLDGSAIYSEGDSKYDIYMEQHNKWIRDRNEGVQDAKIETKFSIGKYFAVNEDALNAYKETLKNQLLESSIKMAETIVPQLLVAGVNIHEVDNNRMTAMMIADTKRDEILVQALIKNGANEFDLKVGNPEYKYLTDWNDCKNIHNEPGNWRGFVKSITESVKNRILNKYPYAQLNTADNSISFFVSTDIDQKLAGYNEDHNQNFIKSIEDGYFVEQLKFQSRQMGFKLASGKDFLEVKPTEMGDLIEYKFNISAENLDSILQLNSIYSGYRNEGGLLKLVKDFSLKPDSIMLWPLHSLDDEGKFFHVMAAGCQTSELPTLQLMKLLPNYESEILPHHKKSGFSFHWIPEEVGKGLLLNSSSFLEVLKKVFLDNGVKVSEGNNNSFYENPDILQIEDRAKMHGVEIVPMNENTKDFYALYGNIAKEELSRCVSLEVKVMTFFEAIKDYLNKLEPNGSNSSERISNAKATIELMIERERSPNSAVEFPTVSEANSKGCCVIS
jgi:ankyrin repeat protein